MVSEIHAQNGEFREWFEVYNASSRTIDLEGLLIKVTRLDGGADARFLVRSGVTMGPEEYVVFGNELPGAEPTHVDYGYHIDIASQSTSDNPKLLSDSGAMEVESCGERIDLLIYRNLPSNGSFVLDGDISPPTSVDNDAEDDWCVDETENVDLGIRGTPQQENPICPE